MDIFFRLLRRKAVKTAPLAQKKRSTNASRLKRLRRLRVRLDEELTIPPASIRCMWVEEKIPDGTSVILRHALRMMRNANRASGIAIKTAVERFKSRENAWRDVNESPRISSGSPQSREVLDDF